MYNDGVCVIQFDDAQGPEDLRPDVVAYQRLEFLTQAIKNELQRDLQINDAGVLPPDIVLPQITAAEYGRVCSPLLLYDNSCFIHGDRLWSLFCGKCPPWLIHNA